MNTKKILIIAGEASGDMHAAELIKKVQKLQSNTHFFGIGGSNMREAGAQILMDIKDLSVIGLFDVITHAPQIYKALQLVRKILRHNPPDLLILVDYPGLNIRLARFAKNAGVKVFYYISPQLWASREYRIKAIQKYVDKMAVIFPFEVDFYKKFNVVVSFVGNPLTEKVKPTMPKEEFCRAFDISSKRKIIGLFPGSRHGEIKKLLPVILQTAELLQKQLNNTEFVLALASSLTLQDIQIYLDQSQIKVKIISAYNYDVMQVCDAIIAASGTATLEMALMETPMVVIYKIFPPYFPIKKIIKIPYISLCNIIAGKEIAKELLQQHANPKEISTEVLKIINDDNYRNNMRTELAKVKDNLLYSHQENIAEIIVKLFEV